MGASSKEILNFVVGLEPLCNFKDTEIETQFAWFAANDFYVLFIIS